MLVSKEMTEMENANNITESKRAQATRASILASVKKITEPKGDTVVLNSFKEKADELNELFALSELLDIKKAELKEEIKALRRGDEYSSSYALVGESTPGVSIAFSDSGTIKEADIPLLKQLTGDNFGNWFTEERSLELKGLSAEATDKIVAALIGVLGVDGFKNAVNYKVQATTKKGFDKLQFNLSNEIKSVIKMREPTISSAKKDYR
jgi:hypothetical protein